ncbi:MAG: hypothetical protein M1549_03195 [Candidatus Dependentiae bacterium]|nr:hypothetical protein [Candidatus Dependentiae bacterium]
MSIIDTWLRAITLMKPQSIIKLGFVCWKNLLQLIFTIFVHWWPLLLLLIACNAGMIERLFEILCGAGAGGRVLVGLSGVPCQTDVVARVAVLVCVAAIGMWVSALILSIHPSLLPKGREYYRTHLIFFCGMTLLVLARCQVLVPVLASVGARLSPWVLGFPRLFVLFACFFMLDARPAAAGYLRAITIYPFKLFVFNLPLVIPLYLLLVVSHWVPVTIQLFVMTPLVVLIGSILYRLTANQDYEAYYGGA